MPLKIIRQDITKIECDAIVNPSNTRLYPGGGTDLSIHKAAGPELLKYCEQLGGCEVGQAKISPAFELPCKFVIHTVGPVWQENQKSEDLLVSCYKECLAIAKEYKLPTKLIGVGEKIEDINVHKYGAHIFHTSNKEIWDYVNSLAKFNDFINRYYKTTETEDKIYLMIENPRIRSCQKYLTIYENDKVQLEDLYFLYDLNFNILKTKCVLKLTDNEEIVINRLTGVISFPEYVKINKDKIILNHYTKALVYLIVSMNCANDKKPITIEILNTRVDTARDLVLKLFIFIELL